MWECYIIYLITQSVATFGISGEKKKFQITLYCYLPQAGKNAIDFLILVVSCII